jgi:hypothetical protein
VHMSDTNHNNNDGVLLTTVQGEHHIAGSDGMNCTVSAEQVWNAFMDDERNMSEDYNLVNSIADSLSNYKRYYKYRLGQFIAKESSRSDTINKTNNPEFTFRVSQVLNQMSLDVHMTTILLLQALDYGADVNYRPKDTGDSIFHNVARLGNFVALQCLINSCSIIDCGIRNQLGQTPLILACQDLSGIKANGKTNVVKLLLTRRDVRIDHCDLLHHSALFYSVKHQNWRVCRSLLKNHASVLLILSDLSILLPCLIPVAKVMSNGASVHSQLHAIRNSQLLSKFISNLRIDKDFVDYRLSSANILLRVASMGIQKLLEGMLSFRLQEELRSLKSRDPVQAVNYVTKVDHVDTEICRDLAKRIAEEETAVVDRRYQLDLAHRRQFHAQHKREKKDSVRERRLQHELLVWDENRSKVSRRLDEEFKVKIKGLFV